MWAGWITAGGGTTSPCSSGLHAHDQGLCMEAEHHAEGDLEEDNWTEVEVEDCEGVLLLIQDTVVVVVGAAAAAER